MNSYLTTPETLSSETIASYKNRGFVHVPGIISREEAEEFRQAALKINEQAQSLHGSPIFNQFVNVWQEDEVMKRLTLHANVSAVARKLAQVPLRLWHDHILIKAPHNQAATEFHQDQPYWPHANSPNALSAWIALCDVPVERGCMSFIPGSFKKKNLEAQNLGDARDLFAKCPELEWEERVTIPLRAGDCTFHHGLCAHMATPNHTDEPRVAHIVIFMDATTQYTGARHVVTDPLELEVGEVLEHELFPIIAP